MKIFSSHRRKLQPSRRFGGRVFKSKVKSAANYKRAWQAGSSSGWQKISRWFGRSNLAFWRNTGFAVLLVLFYFLVWSHHFVVSNISVIGNQAISTQQVIDAITQAGDSRLFLIKKNDYFLLTQGRVNHLLTQAIPEIKYVTSKRRWPNQIAITVHERIPGFVIASNGHYFLVDEEGVVVKPIGTPGTLVVAQDQLIEDFASNETLGNKLAPFILSMIKSWSAKVSTPIANVKFPGKASSDVEFGTTAGWSVIFDTNRSVVSELDNLALLLNKQISVKDQTRLSYIDLRLTKWAYYCFKASPCSQVPQAGQ